ncbi:MAG: PQQ-binding-like beta-propeller repeat protein [Oligoflexia bacterium]|nr:PQQ-binding-like beta-propeller repeat protein [Oligoflexia bacterium]
MNELIVYHGLIIPSVVIPFTALLAALSALATFIAGLFGLQLKAEGPKKLLEVLLKPRVLIVAFLTNLIFIGAIWGYRYWINYPSLEWTVVRKQNNLAKISDRAYTNTSLKKTEYPTTKTGKIEQIWEKSIDSGSFRGVTISGDSLFIGNDAGYVVELDKHSGEKLRSFYVGTSVSPAPIIFNNYLYAGEGTHDTHHARLYKFNLATGKYEGSYQTKGHIEGGLVAATLNNENTIYVVSGSDGLHAIEPETLKEKWKANDGHVDSAVFVVGDRVFSGTGMEKEKASGNRMFAVSYDFLSGQKIWKKEIPASSWMQSIGVEDKICFVLGEVYFASDLGGVYCFLQKDGVPSISYNNDAPIASLPIQVEQDLVVSDLKGKICRVSLTNGLPKWCTETKKSEFAFSNPVLDARNGVLVYASESDGVYILDPKTGKVIEKWKPTNWVATYASAAVEEGSWYTVDMKGMVRKLHWTNQN